MRAIQTLTIAGVAALVMTSAASAATTLVDFEDGTWGETFGTSGSIVELGANKVVVAYGGPHNGNLADVRLFFQFYSGGAVHPLLLSFDILSESSASLSSISWNFPGHSTLPAGEWVHITRPGGFYIDGLEELRLKGTMRIYVDNLVYDTASLTTVVPEPATWTMMILGFTAVGGAVRRRRRTAEVAVIG